MVRHPLPIPQTQTLRSYPCLQVLTLPDKDLRIGPLISNMEKPVRNVVKLFLMYNHSTLLEYGASSVKQFEYPTLFFQISLW